MSSPPVNTGGRGAKRLSVIIPFYNEARTLREVVERVECLNLPLEKELIAVDDGSTDDGAATIGDKTSVILLRHDRNRGKGAAVRTGMARATGDIVLVQDADLELDPHNIPALVAPILAGRHEVVYGSRNLGAPDEGRSLLFSLGGRLVTRITNLLYGTRLTDEVCGYKAFTAAALAGVKIERDGFEWEEEITVRMLRKGHVIGEVPVTARSRSMKQGKKLRRRDGLKAVWMLVRLRFFR